MSAKSRQGGRKPGLKTLVTTAVTCLVVVTGCSPSGARTQALNELSSHVHTIRGAASVGDFETALERLDALRARAWDMFRQDELPQDDLENILAAAEAVENHLPLSANPPPPPEPVQHEHGDEEEEEARRQAEEEARQQAEEEARKQQEEAQKQAEEAARKQAEEEAKKQEEAQKQAEEAAKEREKNQRKEQEQAQGGDEGQDGEDNGDDD